MVTSMKTSNKKNPLVLTVKESNVPKNFLIIGRLTNGNVVAVHSDYLVDVTVTDDEHLKESD